MLENAYMQISSTNRANTPRQGRKYIYGDKITQNNSSLTKRQYIQKNQSQGTPCNSVYTNQSSYIAQLQQQLKKQRQKSKMIEQHAIRQQTNILEQINMLQQKFNQVQKQKIDMKQLLQESYKQINQYKKVKGIAQAMINMMAKVEGKEGNYHDAWRWIKKVVWEYETIKSKALHWKKAHDKLKKQERSDTFSNDSNDSSLQQDQ